MTPPPFSQAQCCLPRVPQEGLTSALRVKMQTQSRNRVLQLGREGRHVQGICSELAGDYSGLKRCVLD